DRARLARHVAAAVKRARRAGEALAAVTVALGDDVDPLAVAIASRRRDEPWFAFEQAGDGLAALGCARALDARGARRFGHVAARWRTLAGGGAYDVADGPRGCGPVAVGGFAFAPDGAGAPHWAG